MPKYNVITREIREAVMDRIGSESVISDPSMLGEYNCDASEIRHTPELVVRPHSVKQIQDLMVLAGRYNFPVTPRGAGSGLSGGAVPRYGGIVLDTSRMNRILEIDPANMMIVLDRSGSMQGTKWKRKGDTHLIRTTRRGYQESYMAYPITPHNI